MRAALRSGAWVTRQRLVVYSIILLAVTVGSLIALIAGSDGPNDARGRPLGTDFSNVYAAGTLVRDGMADAPFVPARQFTREQQIFGKYTPFYGWHYPPFFLLIAAALAALPYLWALALWQGATLLLYLRVQWLVVPNRLAVLASLAFPAVLVNITHGHNGFLTAALLGAGLVWLPTRPILAGVMFGLLVYKPQFGMLIPLALLAAMQWRAMAGAALTVVALAVAVMAWWGVEVWSAFLDSLPFTRQVVLEEGGTGFYKLQSVFAAVRLWGGSVTLAYAAQFGLMLGLAKTLWCFWRSDADAELKGAALILACFLATPYSLDYDLMAVAPAMAFLVRHGLREGFAPYEKSLLAAAFILPLVARMVAMHLLLPIGPVVLVLLYLSTIRRTMAHS